MLDSFTSNPQSLNNFWSRFEKPITALFVTLGLAAVGLAQSPAWGAEVSTQERQGSVEVATSATAQAANSQRLANGIYLFGQSPQPNQLGSAYMVFEVTQNQVVGGFYMPSSSFDCFYGELQANQMALNVVDSYEQTVNPFAVAMSTDSSVAQTGGSVPVTFEGFHRLSNLSDTDNNVLNTCRADRQRSN